nr:MFS transporter [Thiorhodococcus minor]
MRQAGPTLALGLLLTLSSSIGQTYFIGLFAGAIRGDLVLSHAGFGGIYTLATTASAACLLWLGKVADRVEPARLAAWVMLLLAVAALAMAMTDALWLLAVALFGLRFFGQGMLGHIAVTLLARRFAAGRGRALGIAMLGYPIGEALLPLLVALALAAFDWRAIWLATALAMVLMIPAVLALGRAMCRRLPSPAPTPGADGGLDDDGWTRAEVLRDRRFHALLPALAAAPFLVTGVLFHQVHLAQAKGWTLAQLAACYPVYAIASTAAALGSGWLIDRIGAVRLLPLFLLPMALGLALVGGDIGQGAEGTALIIAACFMGLLGITPGSATVLFGALWAEVYGTRHLGAIRALAMACMVFATALAPGVLGWLLDRGVEPQPLLLWLAGGALLCALSTLPLLPSLRQPRNKPRHRRPLPAIQRGPTDDHA